MTKTLKDLFEVYKPKVKGEQRFVDKHVVVKHKDKNGNGDDVFNATNVKSVDKSPEHGYNAGEDEAVYEDTINEISSAAIKRYKGAALDNLNYHSKQWDRLAKLHSFTLGQEKAFDKHDKEAEKRYSGIKRANNRLGKPGHDLKEEDLYELSKKTLANYITKSAKDMGSRRAGAARTASVEGKRHTLKKAGKRLAGIDRAAYKLTKENTEQIDELSKSTLSSYIKKAGRNAANADDSAEKFKHMSSSTYNKVTKGKLDAGVDKFEKRSAKRLSGIIKASGKLANEKLKEENIQELDRHGSLSRYINKTKYDDKRKSGRDLALKKKWGDSNYGLPEPKVKGVNRIKEDVDLQELSKKTLASYINKAAVKNLAHAGSLATQAHDKDENKRKEAEGTAKKLVNKLDGIHRATKRLAKD